MTLVLMSDVRHVITLHCRHGLQHVQYNKAIPAGSNTALPITTSASFNRSLWHATANQVDDVF
jgi:hypothetical protein